MSIQSVSSPWTLKGTVHILFTYLPAKTIPSLSKDFLFSPLEAASSFSDGKHLGGLACIQIIRYTESPVGPYDELIVVPGKYEYLKPTGGKDEDAVEKKQNMRVTRIYVSQKETCWNGRINWNIPKHLARFEFINTLDGSMTVSVYPSDVPSTTPFFKTTFTPMRIGPTFPASTSMAKYVGVDLMLVQPPLPKGENGEEELPGTQKWCALDAVISSKKCSLEWFDLEREATENDALLGGQESGIRGEKDWWKEMGLWKVGLKMENATILFGERDNWSGRL